MSTETPTLAATPAASSPAPAATPAAPESNWDNFKITDEQFKQAGFTDADLKDAGSAVTPPATPAAAPAVTPPAVEPPKPDENALNLDVLKDPDAPAAAAPAIPALSPDQAAVLKFFPNADIAAIGAQGLGVVNAYAKGNTAEFLQNLQQINPQAFSHLQETLYQTLMPQWVDRYIAENDPNSNPQMTAMQKRLEAVERERAQEKQQAMTWQQQQQHTQRLQAVDGEINKLFDMVKFNEANGFDAKDREFVTKAIRHDLAGNRQVLEQAWGGNLAALRPIFREKVNDYVQRDKLRAEKLRSTAQTQQDTKRPPVQAAGVGTTTTAKGTDKFFEQAAAFVRDHT
jgi:hypothetical protein